MSVTADEFEYTSLTTPAGAVFVAADEPLLIYPSAKAAERHLEAIDVASGVYTAAFGASGEPYVISSADGIVVVRRSDGPDRQDDFRALLVRYLDAHDHSVDPAQSVFDLANQAWRIEADFWQEHDPYGDRFSQRIPGWACLTAIAAVALAIYLVLR